MANGDHLFILHRIPGRVRIAGEPLRVDEARAERIAVAVRALPAIQRVRVSPLSASVIIEYEVGVPLAQILRQLGQRAELLAYGFGRIERERPAPPSRLAPAPARTVQAVLNAVARVNSASQAVVPPHVDLKIIVPGAIFGYGVFRLLTGRYGPTPHWLVFFMYGFDAFAVLNQGIVRKFLESAGGPPPRAEARS